MAMKKQKTLPGPYAAPTKDMRFAGTYEVLGPAPDRVKPHRVPLQFASEQEANAWIHSSEGADMVAELLGTRRR